MTDAETDVETDEETKMEKHLRIYMKGPAHGLPTACPQSLPLYCYCIMAGIPFTIHKDTHTFDLDFSPPIRCNQYSTRHGIEDLVTKKVANLDYNVTRKESEMAMALHAWLRYWLGNAITYELWLAHDAPQNTIPYHLQWLPLERVNQKIQAFTEKLGLLCTQNEIKSERIEEIYKRAAMVYDALSMTLGQKDTFFENRLTSLDAAFLGHALFVQKILPNTSRLHKELQQHANLLSHANNHGRKIFDSFQGPSIGTDISLALPPPPPRVSTNWTMENLPPKCFELFHLQYYTRNFDEERKISEGAFGEVFLGCVIDSTLPESNFTGLRVAVKRSHGIQKKSEEIQWNTEVKFMSMVKHLNILQLWGHCKEGKNKYLVYEFMENGSVSRRLEDLNWSQTRQIALGSAKALEFLHMQTPPIVFADFRSPNTLLDKNFSPKLGDFGQAKEENQLLSNYSVGYNDPENSYAGQCAKREVDIFSMGILLLQLLTKEGNPVRDHIHIHHRVRKILEEGGSAVHQRLVDTGCSHAHANLITQLALECVNPDMMTRSTIKEVVERLENLMF